MDKLQEDARESTWEDYIETANAALAMGAGAVYFLRHGGARQLNKFGDYLTGLRSSMLADNLDDSVAKFRSDAYKKAMSIPNKIDVTMDIGFQAAFKAHDIRAEGKEFQSELQRIRFDTKLEYGRSMFDQMISSTENHYLDENSANIVRSMLSEFAYDTEDIGITQTGIRAKLTNALGEDVSQETLDEAVKFASAIQQKMKDPALNDMMKDVNHEWVIDVGNFTGFDKNGAAIFDPNTIVDQIRSSNSGVAPADEIQAIAKKASDILEAQRYKQEQRSQGLIKPIIDTALGDEVTVAEAEEAIARGELSKDIFASRAFQRANAKEPVFQNSWDSLMELRDEYKNSAAQLEAFNKITIDGLRRDKDGKIYATTGIRSLQESASEMLADTLPGKMLRVTETLYNAKHPEFLIFGRGSLDYTLAQHLGNARKAMETSERVIYMFGRFYRENGTSDLEEITSLRDHTIIASDIGTGKDMLENIRKAEYYKQQGKKPWLERIKDSLDVKPTLKPLDEKYGNNFDWLLNRSIADYDLMEYYIDQAIQGKNQNEAKIGIEVINRTHRFLQNIDKHASLQGASSVKNLKAIQNALSSYVGDTSPAIVAMQEAIKILEDPTNEAAIAYASQIGSKDVATNIQNESLAHLITDFKKNALRTTTQKMTHTDVAKLKAGSIHFVSDDFRTNIAQELIRESFMRVRIAAGEDRAANIINHSLGRAFSGKNTEELIRLQSFAAISMLDARMHRNAYDQQKEEIAFKVIDELRNIGSTKSTANDFITKSLNEFNARNNLPGGLFQHADKLGYDRGGELFEKTNAWSVVHQSYTFSKQFRTAANILRNNNGQIFEAAKEALKPLTQYVSGNDAFGALSKSSIVGYRVLNLVDEQLNHEFDALGYHFNLRFGLRAQDKGSGFEIYKNLLLKRVLPAAAIYTYLDFADDTARSLTGMGIGEAGVSGLANANLALRKVTGATGLDYVLKGVTSDSPIAQYYAGFFGDTNPEWHSYEEEKEYYERGYTPIRKSRYWVFGSSNEYRGGKISYFEPNTLRMMRSNYFMESMYEGSMWTKWSHSLLPTPLNPLSPLNYWLDPYYLEELHKEDRPYPITGSTFAENTPWGIFLNPIADTFIKPRRRMHQDRLGSNGVDVKALVAHINNQIQQRASNAENGDIIYLQNGKLRSMLFTAFNAPTPSERVISSQGDAVTVSTEYGEYGAGISAEEYSQLAESNTAQLRDEEVVGIPAQQSNAVTADELSVSDRLVISSGKGNIAATALVQTMKQTGVFDALRGANIKIRQQGMLRKDQGFFYENKMQYERSSMEDMLSDSETISDLMTAGKGHDYVHEMAVSSRMITGLYGYMFSAALGIGSNNQKQIATSANMESAGRSFWDLSVGGFGGGPFGGEIMEIARRFIPEYHRMQQVNPLMNTMPDWLPERMRFGDAYCVSGDTLIEVNNLQFIPASDIIMSDNILTHKGQLKQVEGVVARSIQKQEKVYQFKICSISAIESRFSEDHPILRCKSPEQRRNYSPFVKIKLYEQANLVLDALNNGIILKRDLAECCGSDIDSVYRIFNVLYQNGLIEDPKTHKHFIDLKQYKPFDLELLRRDLEWTKAKDIQPGDYVAYPLPKYNEQDIILDLANYIKDYPATNQYIYTSGTLRNIETAEAYEWLEENGIPIFNHRDRKPFLEQHHWNAKSYENAQTYIRTDKQVERISRYIKLTPELCYAFGVYTAEGWPNNQGICLATHVTETWMTERVFAGLQTVFPRISYRFRQVQNTNGAQTTITGKYIGILCAALFGKGAHNKHVPEFMWNAKPECILRFIEGYLDGDGCHYVTKSGVYQQDSFHIGATSVSLSLLLQIRKLLLRFGVVGSVQHHTRTSVIKQAQKLKQKVIKSGISYAFCIRGWNAEYLSHLLWKTKKPSSDRRINTYSFISEGYVYLRVLEKTECPEINTVYGFQINVDKSFCTAGIATHNTSIPKGEARLPGRGYEALNELHPDIFGQYGAFDRFKILADVAPYSPEYKFWKKVAGSTIRDPKLKKEMQEIKDRVAEQTSGHDFYDYKYIGRGMSQQNAVVSEVLNFGKFKIVGSEQVYKLSGVKISGNPDETTQQVLSRYLLPGQEVTLYTDENPSYAYNTDKDHTINAGVMIAGENVAEQMLKAGDAKKRKGDTSAPTYMLNHNVIVNTLNMAQEALGHANIPVLHSRFLKIESPLESYLDDNVYGTSFQNWSDVWGTYIRPSLQIEASSPIGFGVGLLGTIINNTLQDSAQTGHNLIRRELEDLGWMKEQASLNKRVWASRGFRLLDRGAFIGGMAADITFMGSSKALSKIQTAQSAGHVLGVAYAAAANPNNLAVSTMAWGRLGYLAAEYMLRNEADDVIVRKTLGKSAALGAAIGAVRWAAAKKMLASDETANTYIPEATRKKWDMQDYFDRLTYIKYMGLYEQAADLAKSKEGVDIRRIIAAQENERKELQEEKEKLHQDLRDLDRRHDADAEEAKKLIRKRLNSVSGAKVGIRGGEYTKSAIMYKNAADATMYGLQEDALMADIVRALPKTERDYFIEFMKEKDQEKREEILKTVSPLLNRALRTIWKMPLPEKISNEEYFEHHTLPAPTWAGWRPDIDLANVEAKVIYNQGMQFSDIGIYASQYRDPAVINAPNIDYNRSQNSTFLTRLKLQMAMTGLGISSEGISVEPSQDSGIQVVANIAQVIPYKVGEEFDKLFSI